MMIDINWEKCIKCMGCLIVCSDIFESHSMNIIINRDKIKKKCTTCDNRLCEKMCPTGAIEITT